MKIWGLVIAGLVAVGLVAGCDAAATEPLQVGPPASQRCEGITTIWVFPLHNFLSRPLEVAVMLDDAMVTHATVPKKRGTVDPGEASAEVRQSTPSGFESVLRFAYAARNDQGTVVRAGTAADMFILKNSCASQN